MRNRVPGAVAIIVAAAFGAVIATIVMPVAGQAPANRPPRGADGRPDLNGIWQVLNEANFDIQQVLNEANFDIQTHMARPAMALRAGPYGPLPAAPVLALGAVD